MLHPPRPSSAHKYLDEKPEAIASYQFLGHNNQYHGLFFVALFLAIFSDLRHSSQKGTPSQKPQLIGLLVGCIC